MTMMRVQKKKEPIQYPVTNLVHVPDQHMLMYMYMTCMYNVHVHENKFVYKRRPIKVTNKEPPKLYFGHCPPVVCACQLLRRSLAHVGTGGTRATLSSACSHDFVVLGKCLAGSSYSAFDSVGFTHRVAQRRVLDCAPTHAACVPARSIER